MAKCDFCGQEMLEAQGCRQRYIGQIPYGAETAYAGLSLPTRCRDCNVEVGQYHHPGCDIEECEVCHGQMLVDECRHALLPNLKGGG